MWLLRQPVRDGYDHDGGSGRVGGRGDGGDNSRGGLVRQTLFGLGGWGRGRVSGEALTAALVGAVVEIVAMAIDPTCTDGYSDN